MALLQSTVIALVFFGYFVAAQQLNYTCDFEEGLCGFLNNDKDNKENWKIGKGSMNSQDTGPTIDNTKGSSEGQYLYVNVTAAKTRQVKLQTTVLNVDYCVKFFYHMYGADVGQLIVEAQPVIYPNVLIRYFYRQYTQGDRWKEAHFSIVRTPEMKSKGYRVIFTVKHSSSRKFKGDIALDDIELLPGKCADTTRYADQLCSFDDYDCGYQTSGRSGAVKWEWSKTPRRSYFEALPKQDHTLGTVIGGYWFTGTTDTSYLQTAVLSSPQYNAPAQPLNCLHFYYYMHGDEESRMLFWKYETKEAYIQAHLKELPNDRTLLATRAKNVTVHRTWTYVEATVNVSKKYQIDFTVGIDTSSAVVIALDDVKLFPGTCPEAGHCDFEKSKCSWTDGEGDFTWVIKKAKGTTNGIKGPATDNTLGTDAGSYIVISTDGNKVGSEANLESELYPPSDISGCISFYYYTQGKDVGTIKVVRKEENLTESTLWTMKYDPVNNWRQASAPFRSSIAYNRFVLRGIIGEGEKGFMAIDDVKIQQGVKCVLQPSQADPRLEAVEKISCSFDDLNLCNWKQDESTLKWKFGNTSLLDSTGPKEPLNGKGRYIFVSSYDENESNSGKIARIQSPVLPSFYPGSSCFSFYFHMFGAHVGELKVFMVPMQDENTMLGRQVIWRRRGTQPDKWIQFRETLTPMDGDFRLEIEAEGGDGFSGDIAIDEVAMLIGECENRQDMCDFESSLCGWENENNKNDKFYWHRGSNLTKGPETDHTTLSGLGYYLQAVAEDGAATGDTANLVSPTYRKSWGPHCLTFWYYRPGLGTGSINVAFRTSGKDAMQWSAVGDVGQFWHYGQVDVSQKQDFKLVFQAVKGRKNENEMAIDDIIIKNSVCGRTAECNFNDDYCSYFQHRSADFAWLLGTGRVVNTQLIDFTPVDNSFRNGMFLYADMTSPSIKENQQATVVSEIIESTNSQSQCVSFSYFIGGTDKPKLQFGIMTLNNVEKEVTYQVINLAMFKEPTGKGWTVTSVDVHTKLGENFQLFFSAIKGSGESAIIALDDITIDDKKCGETTTESPVTVTEMPDSILTCDFDKNSFCSWQPEKGDLTFNISVPHKTTDKMPKYDHTKGNFDGSYAYVQGNGVSFKRASMTLRSAPIEWKGNFCFSFWYYMNVEGRNNLTISAEHKTPSNFGSARYEPFWHRSSIGGYRWRHAYVHIKSSKANPKIRIYGAVTAGVIALDDFAGGPGSCPPSKMCTFDDDDQMCGYTQDSSNTLDWDVKSGEDTDVMNRMPDHTTQSTEGSYLYIGYNGTNTEISQRSRIYSPKRPPSEGSSCVTFYYHIYNVSKLSFNTYLATDNGLSDPQWTMSISQGLLWHGARYSVSPKTVSWQVMFEVSAGSRGYGQVAVDDISVTSGSCPDPGYCDFDTEDCLWENVISPVDVQNLNVQKADVKADLLKDDFDWVRHIGEDYFGPHRDKTQGSPQGFYLLLDSRYAEAGQKAVYVSEKLRTSGGGSCLKFWYAIPDYEGGSSLQILTSNDFKTANQETLVKDGTNEKWTPQLVSILPPMTADTPFQFFWAVYTYTRPKDKPAKYKILPPMPFLMDDIHGGNATLVLIFLVGVKGNHSLGYVAIDDISIEDGVCERKTELFDCGMGQHVYVTDVCNFRKDCSSGKDEANCADCDFETDLCGWGIPSEGGYAPYRWARNTAGNDRIPVDHTKKDSTGNFLLAGATQYTSNGGLNANIQTVSLRNAFSTCSMEFWYNTYGPTKLAVGLYRSNKSIEIWIPPGNSDDLWTFGDVYLGRIPSDFQLRLVATRTRGEECHAAVDDIVLKGCETKTSGGPGTCSSDQFSCKNSLCIPKDFKCDYTDDCGNFEDESAETCEDAVSRCSFDQSFCDWTFENSSFVFQRRAPFANLEDGPTRDHTSGTASGAFLYLPGRIKLVPTRMLGPLLQPVEECQIRFNYDIRGRGSLYLQIKTRTAYGGDEKIVWNREDPTEGYFFVEERVSFEETTDFQVIVEAAITLGQGKTNYIALDDISFSHQCSAKLPPFPTSPPVTPTTSPEKKCNKNTEFSCKTLNQCIPKDQVCNFIEDCADNSDEEYCGQCDFHDHECGFSNIGSGSLIKWKRVQAEEFSETKNSTLPTTDSQDNPHGYFYVVEGRTPNSYNSDAIVRTPELGATAHACKVEFFYHYNVVNGYFKVYVSEKQRYRKRVERFSVNSKKGNAWQFASVAIGNYPKGKVIEYHASVENRLARGGLRVQDIAIDNIKYINCNPTETYNETMNCNFDYDQCGWHPDNDLTEATWSRSKSTIENYGPTEDHTGRGGYFMYVQANTRMKKGDTAHLVSLKQAPTEERCFSFWYHMYGQDVGTLNIFIRTDNGNKTIWSKTNSQGNAWKQGMRTIQSNETYNVVIEAVVGSFAKPVIAIDDISVREERCPHPVACDFESDFCEWKPENWVLQIGGGIPRKDHTTNTKTGRFAALAESSGRLVSPDYNYTSNEYCLNFWYFLEGDRNTRLRVQKDLNMMPEKAETVWSDVAEPGIKGAWLHSRASITGLSDGDYNIVINGTKTNESTIVAVDDVAIEDEACAPYGSCTFERDFCTWRNRGQPISTGLQWIRNSGSTVNYKTGPSVDVTTNSTEGWYIFVDGNVGKRGQTAVLESEILHYSPNACFKYWYHMMNGKGGGALQVAFVNHSDSKVYNVMSIPNNQGQNWYQVKRLVKDLPPAYKIRFIAKKGSSGDIALDDIFIVQDSCDEPTITTPTPTELPPSKWDCDFEAGDFCLWENGDSWRVQDGRKALVNKEGPTTDATKGNAFGQYAYYKPIDDTGHSVISPELDTADYDYCFGFYYYLHSPAPVSLELSLLQYNQEVGPLWVKKSSAETRWKHATYFLEKSVNASIILKATRSQLDIGDIAVDDLKVNTGRCPVIRGRPCDFESGDICGFKVQSPDGITWRRMQAKRVKFGAKVDKTYGTSDGHYMVAVPSTAARVPGDNKAWLIMPNVPSTGIKRSCLRFWYQMAGDDVISLNIYVRTPDGNLPLHAPWSHATKHGNDSWRVGQMTVDANFVHEIVFEAVMQLGNSGFIALDEIVVKDGSCSVPGSCDFEDDMCTWQNAATDVDVEWIRNTGPTPTNGTGPSVDRTLGTKEGSYVYIQADNPARERNLVGILKSEYFSLSTERCLSFWGHMKGSEMGSLFVNVTYYGDDQTPVKHQNLYTTEGDQGDDWFNRKLLINIDGWDIQEEYQILFIGKTKGILSDIALDEIEVTSGKCAVIPDEAFDCKDGTHVNASKVCDFEKDCNSGEDEANCGKCDFEHGNCGWEDKTPRYPDWKRTQGQDGYYTRGPGYDHTYNSSTGYFMMTERYGYPSQEAVLKSSDELYQYKKSYMTCAVKFYYSISRRSSTASLRVRKRLSKDITGTVWQWIGGTEDDWKLGTAYVGSTERPFTLEFVQSVSYERAYVAIDDITFEDCGLPAILGKCRSKNFKCKNERCVSSDFLCDSQDDCGDNSDEDEILCSSYPKGCNFEANSICDWTIKGQSKNPWAVKSFTSNRDKTNSGPLVDHTKGIDNTGRYLVMEKSSSETKNRDSYYHSSNYKVTDASSCSLRFFYYMFGESDISLKVYSEKEEDGWNWEEKFSHFGSLGQRWHRAIVTEKSSDPFHFIIAGNPGNKTGQKIAIDDITLSKGCKPYSERLPTPATTALPTINPCKSNEYNCRSGECIPLDKYCDFTKDCHDGSDEETCGSCTFEKDFCGWEDRSGGNLEWRRQIASASDDYGPAEDHKNSTTGWYAYVAEGSDSWESSATLVFPKMPPTSSHCVMEFWMYRNDRSNVFTVQYRVNSYYSRITTLKVQPELTDNGWQKYEVKIPQSDLPNNDLLITSKPNWSKSWWQILKTVEKKVAIDEINFLNCNPKALPVDCDFDDDNFNQGFCYWSQDHPLANLKWLRGKGSTALNFSGPTSDHTTGQGYYLYLNPTNTRAYRQARLESPKLPMNYPDGSCFTFWYHMYGQHIGTLNVLVGQTWFNSAVWSKSGTQGNKWHLGQVFMNNSFDFQIFVSGISTGYKLNNIAIDDFKMVDGPCPKTATCDFETDLCGWNSTYEGSAGWIRTQGSWNWTDEKPVTDHTLETPDGHYLYFPFENPKDLARLESQMYNNYGDMCVKFWYNMFGNDIGSLAVYQRTTQENREENLKQQWKKSGDHVGGWKLGRVTLKSLPSFYIAIEAQLGIGPLGYIALDDIHVLHGKCSDPGSCSFEIDTCGWTNSDAFADVNWIRRTGTDQKLGKGPTVDSTTETVQGHYMYAYLTGLTADSQSMLVSEDLSVNHDYCLSFYFNMFNAMNTSLYIQQVLIGMGWEGVMEYKSSDFESNTWIWKEVNITAENAGNFFQIGITALINADQDNDTSRGIAIDDVSLLRQSCGTEITTTTLPPTTTTPYPKTKYDCSFEDGWCPIWANDEKSLQEWMIVSGHSNKTLTRPRADVSTLSSSGHYLTLNNKGRSYWNSNGRLITQDGIDIMPEGVCFKFWYHMYGNNPGDLALKIQRFHDDEKEEVEWTRRSAQGIDWKYEQIHITRPYEYKLIFEGRSTDYGDISLDEFSLNTGPCPPRKFCDVEQDYCGFTRDPEGDFQWGRGNGSKTNGPDIDHTLGSKEGNYFYVDTKVPIAAGKRARLESGQYLPNKKCMQFWYYLNGIDVGYLEVLTRVGDTVTSVWKEEGDNSEEWHGTQVVLENPPVLDYSYIFQVTAGSDFSNGYIAVDDILIKDDCPELGSCTFEDDMCLWTNEAGAELMWQRGSGEVTEIGPKTDVTFGNVFGTYLFVHIVNAWSSEPRPAILVSPFFHQTEHRCFNYYSYRGPNEFDGALAVIMYRSVLDQRDPLDELKQVDVGKWVNRQIQVDEDANEGKYQIIFEADLRTKDNFIALDDITATTGQCKKIEVIPDFYCDNKRTQLTFDQKCDFYVDCEDESDEKDCGTQCDFEDEEPNPCNWQTSGKGLAWKQMSANESDVPNRDNTRNTPGEGHYMKLKYIERFIHTGKANFTSPELIHSSSSCSFYFWYYFDVVHANEILSVFHQPSHQSKRTTIFSLEADRGNSWQEAEVIVGRIQNRFQIGFEGSLLSLTGTMAIDDLKFENCYLPRKLNESAECSDNEFRCNGTGRCISKDLLCDFADDCGDWSDENTIFANCDKYPGKCDFESKTFCGWRDIRESNYAWDISVSNPTASYYSDRVLVTRDHTKNSVSGRFLYSRNGDRTEGLVSRLASKAMEAADSSCKFRFFYTYGTKFNSTKYDQMQDIGRLTVYLRKDEVNVWKTLFTTTEPPGQYYEKIVLPIGKLDYRFEIIIEAKAGKTTSNLGGWAVDDLSFTSGCILSNESLPIIFIEPTTEPASECNVDEFYCVLDKKCIDLEMVCDFVPHCKDASDEEKCGTCNFDDDTNPTCGWSDSRGGKWKRVKGSQGNNGLTSGVDRGYYMYVSRDKVGAISSKAIFRSRNFHDASSTCEVSFYYFMSGISNSDASLSLQIQTNKGHDVNLWRETSDQGDKWKNATVSIGSRDAGWHLDFIATHVSSKADIAIDDVEFLLCAPPFKRKCASNLEFACLSGQCIDKNLVCDFSKDCPDGSDERNCTAFYEMCDFEKGDMCRWKEISAGNEKWFITSGKEINEKSGLNRDHTTGLDTGKFLLVETDSYWRREARIISTAFMADISGKCKLRFWQHYYSSYYSYVKIYIQYTEDTRSREINETEGSNGDEWQRIEIPLKEKFPFQVIIAGYPTQGIKGEIAIDDISFTAECIPMYTVITTPVPTIFSKLWCESRGQFTCDDNSCVPFDLVCDFKVDCPYGKDERNCPAFCDFEMGSTCGWSGITKSGSGIEINVTIAKEAKHVVPFSPKVDKTTNTGDGSYLIIHSLVRTQDGPIDQFVSPTFRQSAGACKFTFWHAAGGSYKGLFDIKVSLQTNKESVDMISFQNSDEWIREEIGIGRQKENFSMSINNAKWVNDYIALDDIEFVNCALPKASSDLCTEFRCQVTKACIDSSRVCDLTDDCGDGSDEADCEKKDLVTVDFENGLGIFRNVRDEKSAPLSWQIKTGSHPAHVSFKVGPPFDHTLSASDGHYIRMTTGTEKSFNKRAWLASGVFERNPTKGDCKMRFYYFMYGKSVNQLNVYTRTSDNVLFLKDWTKLWSHHKEVGNFWMRGTVAIKEKSQFEVILEGMAGVDDEDVIALDDISFSYGCGYLKGKTLTTDEPVTSGPVTTEEPSRCKSSEFYCRKDDVCISGLKRCDFREDCKDKSDEEGCVKATCDFKDKDLCGWTIRHKYLSEARFKEHVDTSVYQWIPIQAKDNSAEINLENRPKTDHSSNSVDGWYLLADGAPGQEKDMTALESPTISASNAHCALDFWIYLNQISPILTVYAGRPDDMKQVWNSYINLRESYNRKNWLHAKAPLSSLKNFQVRFEAIRPEHYTSAVSLDDITFEECSPPRDAIDIDPQRQRCGGTEFKCDNGKCIPENLICDYNDDCLDNSDESHCDAFFGRCNFSASVCPEWILERDGRSSWTRQSARSSGKLSIPSTDHTTESPDGQFIMVTSTHLGEKLQPKIRTPTLHYDSIGCKVRFYYNTFRNTSRVLVYRRTSYNKDGMKLIMEYSSDVADYWHRAEVEFKPTDSVSKDYFQIVIAANMPNILSSVSIDDISLNDKCHVAKGIELPGTPPTQPPPIDECSPNKFKCANGKGCFTHLQRCNFFDDCGDNSDELDCGTNCTFEKGMCGWFNAPYSAHNWTMKQGKETDRYSVPDFDHTLKTNEGHFLIPKGFVKSKDSAQLLTQTYAISGGNCKMELYYFMNSKSMHDDPGNLTVWILPEEKGHKQLKVLEVSGRTKDLEWYPLSVPIKYQQFFSIAIEASFGSNKFSAIAVDDITFIDCAPTDPPVECAEDEWMCVEQKQCIKVWEYCDGKYDCKDKSDEFQCQPQYGDCSFEGDNWMEECQWKSKELDFEWSRAKEGRSNDTGPMRNQDPRQPGYFLFIDSSTTDLNRQAGIVTPLFKASKGKCHLRFWYTMYGSNSLGTLEVFSEGEGGQIFPVWRMKGNQGPEWQHAHVLVGNSDDYVISFVATRGGDNLTDIAIDTVRFTHGCEEGGIPVVPTGSTKVCLPEEFRCKSGPRRCVHMSRVCDCVMDCSDGSDEDNCKTTCLSTVEPEEVTYPTVTDWPTVTVIPQKKCQRGDHMCLDDNETCIPGLLLCDGVEDCPDGSDEKYGCQKAKFCGENFFFCMDKADPPCVHRSLLCNGHEDCNGGLDESDNICKQCPKDFCLNGGNCSLAEGKPICKCKEGYLQNRCSRKSVSGEYDELRRAQQSGVGWIIGVVIGTILMVAIMFIIWYKRNTNAERARLPHAVDNPVYGLNLDTLTFGELNSHMPVRTEDGAGSTAIENPLYAFKSEIK